MGTLSGPEILRRMELGDIEITPFDPAMVNSNSVNLRLSPHLLTYQAAYDDSILDMARDNPFLRTRIPVEGFVLRPGILYLGCTIERTVTHNLVPVIEGRSGIGRLGASVHLTAGFGEHGFDGTWTLEITVVHPLRVYAGVPICQIVYSTLEGEPSPYDGSYQGQVVPEPSQIYRWFEKARSHPLDIHPRGGRALEAHQNKVNNGNTPEP